MNFAAEKQIIPTRLCTVPIRTGSFKRFCTVMTDKSSNLSQSETKQDSIIPMPGRALKKMTIGSGRQKQKQASQSTKDRHDT